jgi:CheY-like chemotaxis protein
VVDFGLAHEFCSHLTDPRALLGSVEFMPPEQSHDPSAVGPEADVYGLAATMFWVLTGEPPYPYSPNIGSALRALQRESPRRLSELRPDVPRELDELMARILSRDPSARPTPLAVSTAMESLARRDGPSVAATAPFAGDDPALASRRVLVVEHEQPVASLLRSVVEWLGCQCERVAAGPDALEAAARVPYDLVLLDRSLPGMGGMEVCRRLREQHSPWMKVIVVSAAGEADPGELLGQGADDVVEKPFEVRLLRARVEQALRVKARQEALLSQVDQVGQLNRQLEQLLETTRADLHQVQESIRSTLAMLGDSPAGAESRKDNRPSCG